MHKSILLSLSIILGIFGSCSAITTTATIQDLINRYGPQAQFWGPQAQQQARMQIYLDEQRKQQAAAEKAQHEAQSLAGIARNVPFPYLKEITIKGIPPQLVYGWSPAPYALLQNGTNVLFNLKQVNGAWQLDPATVQIQKDEASLLEGGSLIPSSCIGGQNYQTITFIPQMRNEVPYELAIISRSPDQYSDFSLVFNINLFLNNIKSIVQSVLNKSIDHVFEWYISVTVWGLTQLQNSITIDSIDMLASPPGCSQPSCIERYTLTGDQIEQFQKEHNLPIITPIDGIIPGENRAEQPGVKNPPCKE